MRHRRRRSESRSSSCRCRQCRSALVPSGTGNPRPRNHWDPGNFPRRTRRLPRTHCRTHHSVEPTSSCRRIRYRKGCGLQGKTSRICRPDTRRRLHNRCHTDRSDPGRCRGEHTLASPTSVPDRAHRYRSPSTRRCRRTGRTGRRCRRHHNEQCRSRAPRTCPCHRSLPDRRRRTSRRRRRYRTSRQRMSFHTRRSSRRRSGAKYIARCSQRSPQDSRLRRWSRCNRGGSTTGTALLRQLPTLSLPRFVARSTFRLSALVERQQ